jgi:SAM-dependent methyltransferase
VKLCQACSLEFDRRGWVCPGCGEAPATIGGFPAFDPDRAAGDGASFPTEYFARLAQLEGHNFWFRARNRLIIWALGEYFGNARSFLEVGCGTGFVLSGIAQSKPVLALSASEMQSAGLAYAAKRVPHAQFLQMDARRMPFVEEFDVIGAFDVLEHIDEDDEVLAAMCRAVRPGGGVILTVPQHPRLWSAQDEHAGHVRRYTRGQLVAKMRRAGFALLRASSFVSLLLPLLAMARLARWRDAQDPFAELRIGGMLNRVLEKTLDFERALIARGISFPYGGSLLALGRKI